MTTRIGVLADTHCPEFMESLPDAVFKAFERVDLILHAGDVNEEQTLASLRRVAPVEAVRGDHDHTLYQLPTSREVLVEGHIPAGAVKGAAAMALTRGLQFVQGVGIVVSAYDLGRAAATSYGTHSVVPIAKETVRQAGGWGGAWAGAELGGAAGLAVGIETGPGAIITGLVGGLVGGVAGFMGADWVASRMGQ